MVLRTDYTNDTDATDTHPAAHNDANAQTNTNTANIATNSSAIATNTADIASHGSRLTTDEANIASNTSQIATNTSAIAALTPRVTALEARVGPVPTGRWIWGWDPTAALTSTTGTAGRAYAVPWYAPQSFDQVTSDTLTPFVVGATLTFGVYATDATHSATSLIAQANYDANTAGQRVLSLGSVQPTGYYWFVAYTSAATGIRWTTSSNALYFSPGGGTPATNSAYASWRQDGIGTPPTLPTTFPPSGWTGSNGGPAFMVRTA